MTRKKTVTPTTIAGQTAPSEAIGDIDDDQQSDPADDRTIDRAADRLHQGLVVAPAVEEAAPGDETGPDQHVALSGPSAKNAQIAPRTAILKERPTNCDMA